MAAPIAGTNGLLKIVGTPSVTVGEISAWSIEIDRDNYDASVLGDTWAESVLGLGHWTGTMTGFFSVSTDAGQTLIQNALLNQQSIYCEFMTQTNQYEGKVNVTKISVDNPVAGIATFDVEFTGNGPLLFS